MEKYIFIPGEISNEALAAYKDGKIIFYREKTGSYDFNYYWQKEGDSREPVDQWSRAFAEYLLLDPPLSSLTDAELAAVYRGFCDNDSDILSEIARRVEESIPGITQAMEAAFSGNSKEDSDDVVSRAILAMENVKDGREHYRLCKIMLGELSVSRPHRYPVEEWEDTDGEAWDYGKLWNEHDPEYLAMYDSKEEGLEVLKEYTSCISLLKGCVGYIVEFDLFYLEEFYINEYGEEVYDGISSFAPFVIDKKLLPESDEDEK